VAVYSARQDCNSVVSSRVTISFSFSNVLTFISHSCPNSQVVNAMPVMCRHHPTTITAPGHPASTIQDKRLNISWPGSWGSGRGHWKGRSGWVWCQRSPTSNRDLSLPLQCPRTSGPDPAPYASPLCRGRTHNWPITTPTFSIQWMTYRGWICTFTYVVIWLRTTRIFWFPCCNKLLAKCSWANIAKSHTKCVVSCVCAHVKVPSKAMYDHTNIHLFKCKDVVQFVPHFVQATHLLLMIE